MEGKNKCEELKKIRKAFAEANGVDYTPSDCSSEIECTGSCPKCELEAEMIINKVKDKLHDSGSSSDLKESKMPCADVILEIPSLMEDSAAGVDDEAFILAVDIEAGDIDTFSLYELDGVTILSDDIDLGDENSVGIPEYMNAAYMNENVDTGKYDYVDLPYLDYDNPNVEVSSEPTSSPKDKDSVER